MAPANKASSDDQFKFLISCIRHSDKGKIDFVEVAKECEIVTKAAAAKRYERMMKANGIHPTQNGGTTADGTGDSPSATPRRKNPSPPTGRNNKKRKLDDLAETRNTDDAEGLDSVKAEPGDGV